MSFFDDIEDWFDSLKDKFSSVLDKNRKDERSMEEDAEIDNDVDGSSALRETPKILKIDLKGKENSSLYNCEKFELVQLNDACIIRRGAKFSITITLDKPVNVKEQLIKLYFNFGPLPYQKNGTQGYLVVSGDDVFLKPHHEWDVRVQKEEGEEIDLEIQVPEDVPVGLWSVIGQIAWRSNPSAYNAYIRKENDIYILFNPWNKEDTVYLEDEEKRDEYVLNDVGKIWIGQQPAPVGRHWVFGQFDDAVLPACMLLMERSGLDHAARGDPVQVSRAISRVVNNSKYGVVLGYWLKDKDDKYPEDGTLPTAWSGSIKILEKFLRTGKPVKFGQCWVFSGVVTTICRALGIPCRSVTNLNSAHDTNNSLTIDRYYDQKGNIIRDRIEGASGVGDSIWNFHVWNDVWMERPDLPSGYGGWQAIDATPQEFSNGFLQCGPASLEAIRRGQVGMNYDVGFVMAEVNADLVRWQRDAEDENIFNRISEDKTRIGTQVLTKKLGPLQTVFSRYSDPDAENCTTDYKAHEGSRAERITLHTAAARTRQGRQAFRIPSYTEKDVEFAINDVETIAIGDDFTLAVTIKNVSKNDRTISLVMGALSEYYTGVKAYDIKRTEGNYNVPAGEEKIVELSFDYDDYFDKLVEYAIIKMVCMATVVETQQTWMGEDNFQVTKPPLEIICPDEIFIGKSAEITLSFLNPLREILTNCFVTIDGPGLTRPKRIQVKDLHPNEGLVHRLTILPKRLGTKNLIAVFNSTQLIDINGSATVTVNEE